MDSEAHRDVRLRGAFVIRQESEFEQGVDRTAAFPGRRRVRLALEGRSTLDKLKLELQLPKKASAAGYPATDA